MAGLVTLSNGQREIVVAGGIPAASGFSTSGVEIFSLDGDGQWREGPPLPYAMNGGASVQDGQG